MIIIQMYNVPKFILHTLYQNMISNSLDVLRHSINFKNSQTQTDHIHELFVYVIISLSFIYLILDTTKAPTSSTSEFATTLNQHI